MSKTVRGLMEERQALEDQIVERLHGLGDAYLTRLDEKLAVAFKTGALTTLTAAPTTPEPFDYDELQAEWDSMVQELRDDYGDDFDIYLAEHLEASSAPRDTYDRTLRIVLTALALGWAISRIRKAVKWANRPEGDPPANFSDLELPSSGTYSLMAWLRGLGVTEATRRFNLAQIERIRQEHQSRLAEIERDSLTPSDGGPTAVEPPREPLKRWYSQRDSRVRPAHVEADGQAVQLDQFFELEGHYLAYPGDPSAPGHLIYNCRCFVIGEDVSPQDAADITETYMDLEILDSVIADGGGNDMNRAYWEGPLAFEGLMTGDGRMFRHGAITWENVLPAPIRHAAEDNGGHGGAVTVGLVFSIERKANGALWGRGFLNLDTDEGRRAASEIGTGEGVGVSVDLDSVDFTIQVKRDLFEERMKQEEEVMPDDPPAPEIDPATGMVVVYSQEHDDEVMVIESALFRAVTLVDIPAFKDAKIALVDSPAWALVEGSESGSESAVPVDALPLVGIDYGLAASVAGWDYLAASGRSAPPSEWFSDPHLEGPTPLRVLPDGRVFGHLAQWGVCHIGIENACVTAPDSPSDYAYFHLGALVTDEGDEIAVGKLTMGTGHARSGLGALAAVEHYDNTGTIAAYVRAGEDDYGIWVAGAIKPGLSDEQIGELRASPLSGDWRRIGGSLELVAALAVNVPGFAVLRPSGMVASGVQTTLVAAGAVTASTSVRRQEDLTGDQWEALRALADERVKATQARRRVMRARALKTKVTIATQGRS